MCTAQLVCVGSSCQDSISIVMSPCHVEQLAASCTASTLLAGIYPYTSSDSAWQCLLIRAMSVQLGCRTIHVRQSGSHRPQRAPRPLHNTGPHHDLQQLYYVDTDFNNTMRVSIASSMAEMTVVVGREPAVCQSRHARSQEQLQQM